MFNLVLLKRIKKRNAVRDVRSSQTNNSHNLMEKYSNECFSRVSSSKEAGGTKVSYDVYAIQVYVLTLGFRSFCNRGTRLPALAHTLAP